MSYLDPEEDALQDLNLRSILIGAEDWYPSGANCEAV